MGKDFNINQIKNKSYLNDWKKNNHIPKTNMNIITLHDPWPLSICQFPIFGDHFYENEPLFCGEPKEEGCGSYCKKHHELTHTKSRTSEGVDS